MAENEHIVYEGLPWLPPDVLDDDDCYQHEDLLKYQTHTHQPTRHRFKSPPLHQLQSRSTLRPQRTSYPTSGAFGGPGMQAVFLDSGQRSCGTGVFLPRRAGNDSQLPNKPARPPVLLPSRVVQALNLNVHELGLQIKQPHREFSKKTKGIDCNSLKNRKSINNDGSGQCCSPEIFLPKEWTY